MREYYTLRGLLGRRRDRKPLELFGSEDAARRPVAVMDVLGAALKEKDKAFADVTVAVQGFGNVGSDAARLIAEQGAKISRVADHTGGVSDEKGLDTVALAAWVTEHGGVKGFAGGTAFDGAKIVTGTPTCWCRPRWRTPSPPNAPDVQASIIVEGANAPTSPEADAILNKRGVLIVPDILANAGGVTVSYFEWAQNIQHFKWDEERVNAELDKTMAKAYGAVRDVATEFDTDLRTAAFILAIRRVAKAALARTHVSAELPF